MLHNVVLIQVLWLRNWEARESTAMVFTYIAKNIPVSAW